MKQITISGRDKAELLEEALSVVEMLSGAPAAGEPKPKSTRSRKVKVDGDADDEPKPKPARKPRKTKDDGPTKDQLREAVQEAIDTYGEEPVKEVFKKHKAKKFSDFKPAQFAAVMEDLATLAELANEDDDDDTDLDLD